ncbi:hypothetical protein MATL_G00126100 [Megalops atlanticus]|uniref:Uncharacterized protein n=1 Tax=Megalops atlanticus TaxID=7932 RepID=A0A9D3PWW0_MEGAT|nr:hypothetical protein MATL_G00126100 [Megalops atlanticus]
MQRKYLRIGWHAYRQGYLKGSFLIDKAPEVCRKRNGIFPPLGGPLSSSRGLCHIKLQFFPSSSPASLPRILPIHICATLQRTTNEIEATNRQRLPTLQSWQLQENRWLLIKVPLSMTTRPSGPQG